jgi:hypothetical protein
MQLEWESHEEDEDDEKDEDDEINSYLMDNIKINGREYAIEVAVLICGTWQLTVFETIRKPKYELKILFEHKNDDPELLKKFAKYWLLGRSC